MGGRATVDDWASMVETGTCTVDDQASTEGSGSEGKGTQGVRGA